MVIKTLTTDKRLFKLINDLKKLGRKESETWLNVAKILAKRRKNRAQINLWKIERETKDNDIIVVPGKVLSDGELTKKVTIIAYSFSDGAIDKIKKNGSKIEYIENYAPKNPKQIVKILK